MSTVSYYTTILGSGERVTIGDGNPVWEDTFGTAGRDTGQQDTHILVEFYGLTQGNVAEVQINNQTLGRLAGYANEEYGDENRHTQILSFPDEHLNDGRNEIQINAVESDSSDSTYDDFTIENMVCMFHQRA